MVVRRIQPRNVPSHVFAPTGSYVPSYWADRPNICPSCSRSNWIVGRVSAECGFCQTALPIAVAGHGHVPDRKAA